jgi:hypothetical protein
MFQGPSCSHFGSHHAIKKRHFRWKQTAGFNVPTTNACGQSAWWKLPREILKVLTI